MADTKKTGSFKGKSNKLGHGGRAAQMKAAGVPGGVIGAIARKRGQPSAARITTGVNAVAEYIDSTSDERIEIDPVRHQYRILTNVEKKAMTHIKDMGLGLIRAIEANVQSSRESLIAVEKVEEAIMWAIKGLTK